MATRSLHRPKTHHSTHESFWCPECGEYGVVYCDHGDEDVWECLYCNHRINLTQGTHQHGHSQEWKFPWEVIFAAILVSLFLYFTRNDFLGTQAPQQIQSTPSLEYLPNGTN